MLGLPTRTSYSASKAGVSGLVRVAAIDFAGEGIRVNGVLPGITETPMNHWWLDDPAARRRLSEAARAYATAHPVDVTARRTVEVYARAREVAR